VGVPEVDPFQVLGTKFIRPPVQAHPFVDTRSAHAVIAVEVLQRVLLRVLEMEDSDKETEICGSYRSHVWILHYWLLV
jgi:hypothetical protein